MALFLVIHEIEGTERIFIADATTKLYANLGAYNAGFDGKSVSVHAFEPQQTRKIGKKMIGRMLTQQEAKALLKKIG